MPTVRNEHAELYYEVHGAGFPVVFIHGGGGNTIAWFQQVPLFAQRYKAITVDLRGFKHSRTAKEHAHPRFYPSDMLAILAAEGIAEAAFVCQSLGAWAGLPIAARHPERVRCIAISGSPTPAYSVENWNVLGRAVGIFNSGGRTAPRADCGWGPVARERPEAFFLYKQISALNPGLFDGRWMQEESVRLYPDAFAGYRTPTIVMGGKHDDFLTPDCHRHAATLIPGATTHTFDDTGHSPYFEAPRHYNEVVGKFLAAHCP